MSSSLPPILPVGTQVVMRVEVRGAEGKTLHPRGAVGVIVQAPSDRQHAYRVRFPDSYQASFRRQELAVLSQFKQGTLAGGTEGTQGEALHEYDLYDHVIYRCVAGSRAYGLDNTDSDVDRRGIYLPPADLHWSLFGIPEQLENTETEECYWELQKFLTMALKANPNVLECLYSPIVESASPIAREMLDMRGRFLSRMVYQTYNGYVLSQFKKLSADIRNHGQVKWKHVMHLLRLLISGVTVLRDGYVPVRVEAERDRLLAVRRGEVPWEEIEAWRGKLHEELEAAYQSTTLPERPDYEAANQLLIKARRSVL